MHHAPLLIAPSTTFWSEVAHALLRPGFLSAPDGAPACNLPALRVVVPTFVHGRALQKALAQQVAGSFIPPRITTMSAWLKLLPPDASAINPVASGERLMSMYAELRQHAWLKKLFTARRNTDLLPLAQILLALCDELTQSLLPALRSAPDTVGQRWEDALDMLSPAARNLLSDEAQLVWSIWKSQLDGNDVYVHRFTQMLRLAQRAEDPLVWLTPIEPDAFERAFLQAYGARQPVLPIMLDWRAAALHRAFSVAWPEMPSDAGEQPDVADASDIAAPPGLWLCAARSLEQEAVQGAQIILNWLQAGKSGIAIIAQDRVVARRMRALLERAQVYVSDETGWKLSTTRAAAAIVAWFDLVAARAETVALLDVLKSPFLLAGLADKSAQVMTIELALRSANVAGGWDAVTAALAQSPRARATVMLLARQAALFGSRKTLAEWSAVTHTALDALGMRSALADDTAGQQVNALLDGLEQHCAGMSQVFSFAEWRAFVSLQMESTSFTPANPDRRVVMLPLNGAHLRTFDAVLMVGADAAHLPSQPLETLFFANAVRRELELATRESRQLQQLRDFTELLSFNREVVLSWQITKDDEPNPVSPWVERLQLALQRSGAAALAQLHVSIQAHALKSALPVRPAPAAPQLLPEKLSASGYNSFVACPYQFFATRMLGLSGLDELSDMPQKRDYGDWLHQILHRYHVTLSEKKINIAARENLLKELSEKIFSDALKKNGAVLGYYVRWQKAMPAYLDWANQREEQGWHFVFGEQSYEQLLQWPEGEIRLHGRIDRIDENGAGERAVFDYKTNDVQALRNKIKQREDQQLPFYGLLSDQPVANAYYVALEPIKDKTGDAEAPQYAGWQQMLATQIKQNMHAITQGAALPANGIESICQYCDVRGLCRKGAW